MISSNGRTNRRNSLAGARIRPEIECAALYATRTLVHLLTVPRNHMQNRGVTLSILAAFVFAVACGSDDTPTGTAAVVSLSITPATATILTAATTPLTVV